MHSALLALLLLSCNSVLFSCTNSERIKSDSGIVAHPATINEIQLPAGFQRTTLNEKGFGQWLRNTRLKKDNTVYLYNGSKKPNQSAQFAVMDISVGNRDLQQCADAVMRLRAEFLLSSGQDDKIAFHATDGTLLDYNSWKLGYRFIESRGRLLKRKTSGENHSRASFDKYLDLVFTYCGTRSLEKELHPVAIEEIGPGDVLIRGGSPGHAVIVMDVAVNKNGEKIFLLAQSYMPAQDIHVLKNPASSTPWYTIPSGQELLTPEWVFTKNNLRRFGN